MTSNLLAALRSPVEIAAEIGKRACARRLALGLRRVDLAAMTGVPEATLKRFETGGKGSVEMLARVALALRAERELAELFPEPPRATLDEIVAARHKRQRARRRRI
jgi:transcriptional regulator with XRE-family HTH domain